MSGTLSLLVASGILVLLIVARVPIAFSLIGAGFAGLVLQEGWDVALAVASTEPFAATAKFSLIIIPLFIALGVFVKNAGVPEQLYTGMSRWFSRVPGGLPIATVAACAAFAAVSGSSAATVAMIGKVSIREMIERGYSKQLAAGVVGSAGTLGILIPPSIALVLFGIISGESIGALLLAGIIPGILSALFYIAAIVVWELRDRRRGRIPTIAPVDLEDGAPVATDSSSPTLPTDLSLPLSTSAALMIVGVLFVIVIGGVYSGVFTPAEASAIGAACGVAVLLVQSLRHHPRKAWSITAQSVRETVSLSGMIFAIFVGAGLFNSMITTGGIPQRMATAIGEWQVAPLLIVALFLIICIPFGTLLDGMAMLLILVPLTYPIVLDLGFSGVWYGILFVKMIELALITPPVGLNIYVLAGTAPEIEVGDAFRGVMPFAVIDVLTIAMLFAFPVITTILPDLAGG